MTQSPKEKKAKQLEWYYKHREEQIKKNREWKAKNREQMLVQKREYYSKNRQRILERKKLYRLNNQEKIKAYRRQPHVKASARELMQKRRLLTNRSYDKQYYLLNKDKIKERQKAWKQRPEVKKRINLLTRLRRRNNPQSNRKASLELQLAMNRVRKRDNNTCKWYGCGLTYREAPIHVHHIFPKSEHPELELIEQYMICYCANHHSLWHRYRGDHYSEMISVRYQEGETSFIRGRD